MSALQPGRVAPARQVFWDWRAAGNFIGGGSGAGVLLYVAAVAPSASGSVSLLGLALVGGGLLCVWLEIGRPWRALNVFRHAESSWMTREAIVAQLLFVVTLGGVWYGSRPLFWLAGGLAGLYLYCQARMLHGGRGIPAWRHPRVVPLLMVTGLTEGCGFGILTQAVLPGAAPAWATWLLIGLVLGRALAYAAYRRGLEQAGAPLRALEVLARFGRPFGGLGAAAIVVAAVGALLPGYGWATGAAGLIAAVSGWWLKFTIVTRAAYGQGFALPTTPVRGAGSTHAGARPGW
jgi:phenylacetyl-CoA:acceptor oxidoreductase subunit 2